MAEYTYKILTAANRKERVRARIQNLETQHYERRLDLIQAKPNQADNILEQLSQYETDLGELAAEEASLGDDSSTPAEPTN